MLEPQEYGCVDVVEERFVKLKGSCRKEAFAEEGMEQPLTQW